MYNKAVLDNGTRIITSPMAGKQSVAVGIWINTGARFETPRISGISHFLEHLVFKGTGKYSCQQIKESIEGVGGSLNGFTTEEVTCFLVKIPGLYLDLALDILADMVINPTLPVCEINRERTVILEEIKMYKDLPQSYVYEILDRLLWPDQPLGMSVLGRTESVSRITKNDLSSYKENYYSPENIVVSAAGVLEPERFKDKVNRRFSRLKKKGINQFVKASENHDRPRLEILEKDTEQTHLTIGFHALNREHPLKYALALLHIILGANSSSRLFTQIRENRGLAYEIGTLVKRLKDSGAFIVHAGVDNKNVELAIKLIFQQLRKVKKELVTKDEFKRAKEFFLGQLMLALEDTMDQMLWIGESTTALDKTYTLSEIIKEVNKVSLQDVGQVSRMIFEEDKTNIALIGPIRTSEKEILNWIELK